MLLVAAGSNSVQQSRTMLQVVVNTGCFCLLHGACVARQQQLGRATTQQQQQSAVVACMSGVCLHYLSPSRGTTGAQCSVHVHLPCLNMSTHMCC